MRRRIAVFILMVLGGTVLPVDPAFAGAPQSPDVVIPIGPNDPVPSEFVFFITEEVRLELEMLIAGLDAGEFDAAQPHHLGEALDLLDQLEELQSREGAVTNGELDAVFFPFDLLYHELTGRWFEPAAFFDPGGLSEPPTPTPSADASPPATDVPVDTSPAPAVSVPPPEPDAKAEEVVDEAIGSAPTTVPATTPTNVPAPAAIEETTTAPTEAVDETATAPTTPIRIVQAAQPTGTISADRLVSILLGLLGLTALLAVAAYLFDHWRRKRLPVPSGRPGFHDLLDVSRRLAAAGSVDEVEILAVRQAMRLTHADAGAFIRRGDRVSTVSYETSEGLLVPDRLNEGALDRVLAAGHELIQTTSTEPAIRHVPVSLLAMPTFNAGAVFGAIVLLRDAERPFGPDESRMASDLKSIVGAAIEHAEHTEQVRAEALADGLTGVRNRRALDLDVADLADQRFSAVMVDLDHFKRVNDTYGHQAGDELLHAVAQRILANVRPIDEVYRYGGEEFAIVMPDTETATAGDIADRVRTALAAAPFSIGPDRVEHQATASLGVATGADGQSVFARADEALYAAKHGGRNRVVVATPAPMPPPSVEDAVAQPLR